MKVYVLLALLLVSLAAGVDIDVVPVESAAAVEVAVAAAVDADLGADPKAPTDTPTEASSAAPAATSTTTLSPAAASESTTQVPSSTTQAPSSTTQAPSSTTQAPSSTTKAPSGTRAPSVIVGGKSPSLTKTGILPPGKTVVKQASESVQRGSGKSNASGGKSVVVQPGRVSPTVVKAVQNAGAKVESSAPKSNAGGRANAAAKVEAGPSKSGGGRGIVASTAAPSTTTAAPRSVGGKNAGKKVDPVKVQRQRRLAESFANFEKSEVAQGKRTRRGADLGLLAALLSGSGSSNGQDTECCKAKARAEIDNRLMDQFGLLVAKTMNCKPNYGYYPYGCYYDYCY